MKSLVIAIDAGTTGVRSCAVNHDGEIVGFSYREFPQYFPQPGWVEHDAEEIWQAVLATLTELHTRFSDSKIAAIGITNQRETVIAWDKNTHTALHKAIVWQDRRTAVHCDSLKSAGHLELIRERTGLVLDPYFSATKASWLLENAIEANDATAIGTVDSWLIYKLSGHQTHITEPSNASRTLLFDIEKMDFTQELCDLFGLKRSMLGDVGPSSGTLAQSCEVFPWGSGIPISGVAGDQQASLFGQACYEVGDTKSTFGTGSFVLMNAGQKRPRPTSGLLTSVAWQIGENNPVYCLEGAVFSCGAAVQWLRDGLEIIEDSKELEPLALSVKDSAEVVFVPAFTGLGSPWWDPHARAMIHGLTRGTTKAHIARAALEAICYQSRDVISQMSQSLSDEFRVKKLKVDGGVSVMDTLLQMLANELGISVSRDKNQQATVLGAALLAGIAVDFWEDPRDASKAHQLDKTFSAQSSYNNTEGYSRWLKAVERSKGWAE